MEAAEDQARKDLGASYELVEIGEIATVDRLLQDLAVEERVDAMITRQTGFGHGGAQAYEMNGPAELSYCRQAGTWNPPAKQAHA